jgi:hypothetical protein
LVEATALRVAALDKLVYCPGVGSGCVLRCQPTERRAIELVGTDSIYSTGVAEGGRSVDAEPLAKDIQCTSTAKRGERLGRLGRSELHPDMT